MTTVDPNLRAGARSRWRDEGGFTISELLLVSVFVVGLIVVAVNSARGIEAENQRSNCQTELRNLKMAVAELHAERGSYPTSVADVVAAGKVDMEDVDSWVLTPPEEGASLPGYRPVVGRC